MIEILYNLYICFTDNIITISSSHLSQDERVEQEKRKEVNMVIDNRIGNWVEDTRRVYSVSLPDGVQKSRIQMVRLLDFPQNRFLSVEAVNVTDEEQFVLGCAANEVLDVQRYW